MTGFAAPPVPAVPLPFFVDGIGGQRFCLFHSPATNTPIRAALVYIHPFAEEMNRSRRMAALQARAFAAAGVAVLQIDLFGCGDSHGDFSDARWAIWKDDIALAMRWLSEQTDAPIGLWGLRLGGLIALDVAASSPGEIDHILLWQPVLNGRIFLTQFLRLRLANQILSGADTSGTQALRDALNRGESLEIAGYELHPELATALDALDAGKLAVPSGRIDWLELKSETGRPAAPATEKVIAAWQQRDVKVRLQEVLCPPFWSMQEPAECPALLETSMCILDGVHA